MISNKPLVSVCMITYNQADYLSDAINGVLKQECNFDIELLISDDCSSDDTAELISQFINENSGVCLIKYIKHKKNKGATKNFFWTIKQAKGKYIAICEGDDYWTDPHKLEMQVRFLEDNPDYSLVQCNASKLHGGQIIGEMTGGLRTWLFRSEVIVNTKYLDKIPYADILARAFLLANGKIGNINKNMAVWRIHENGIYGHDELSKNNRKILNNKIPSNYWTGISLIENGFERLGHYYVCKSINAIEGIEKISLFKLIIMYTYFILKKILKINSYKSK